MDKKPLVGFIGQGFIGKNYADDFERRGYPIVRYSLEQEHNGNKDRIALCDVVFIAVPTPTTPAGFDGSIVKGVLALVGKEKIAVIKSTVLPGTTQTFQEACRDRIILYSPEFLSESTAAQDAAHPFSNIVGFPENSARHRDAAKLVHSILPHAPFTQTCTSTEAEIVKYTHNLSAVTQIVLFNLMYDFAVSLGSNWQNIEAALAADPLISNRYAHPHHKSGRGAGGHCFIKDFEAMYRMYRETLNDPLGEEVFRTMRDKNLALLRASKKDLALVEGVYGKEEKV